MRLQRTMRASGSSARAKRKSKPVGNFRALVIRRSLVRAQVGEPINQILTSILPLRHFRNSLFRRDGFLGFFYLNDCIVFLKYVDSVSSADNFLSNYFLPLSPGKQGVVDFGQQHMICPGNPDKVWTFSYSVSMVNTPPSS